MDTYERLYEAIRKHSGMERDEIIEAGEYGADSGWPGFTYTVDGAQFYRDNYHDVDELLREATGNMGYDNVASLVATFSRADMTSNRVSFDCLLAWFALEEVGRWAADTDADTE